MNADRIAWTRALLESKHKRECVTVAEAEWWWRNRHLTVEFAMQEAWSADSMAMTYFEKERSQGLRRCWNINVRLDVEVYRRWLRGLLRHQPKVLMSELRDRMVVDLLQDEDSIRRLLLDSDLRHEPDVEVSEEEAARREQTREHLDKTQNTALRRLGQRWVYDVDWDRKGSNDIRRRGTWRHWRVLKRHWQPGYQQGVLTTWRAGRRELIGPNKVAVKDAVRGASRAAGRLRRAIIANFDVYGLRDGGNRLPTEAAEAALDTLDRALDLRDKQHRGVDKYIRGGGHGADLLEGCSTMEHARYEQLRNDMLLAQQECDKKAIMDDALADAASLRLTRYLHTSCAEQTAGFAYETAATVSREQRGLSTVYKQLSE